MKPKRILKVYHPADVNPLLVDKSLRNNHNPHHIAPFQLTNQYGETITNSSFEGSIYVADFFFTTCGSICPKMTNQMERVQEQFALNNDVKLLSHSVTPEIDSVPRLLDYAQKHMATKNKWHMVTGDKKHIYELARKSYFAVTDEGTGDEHDFIHTENFILIDKNQQIRGFYDGTSPQEVDQLMEDIQLLLDQEKED